MQLYNFGCGMQATINVTVNGTPITVNNVKEGNPVNIDMSPDPVPAAPSVRFRFAP